MTGQKKQARFLPARVTFLEMRARPLRRLPALAVVHGGRSLALMRAEDCPVHFYRYLYEQIGRPHHWHMRRHQSDAALAAILQAENTILQILYCGGCPAGFAETILHKKGESSEAELLYFGLMRDYQGRGFSRLFLDEIVQTAWAVEIDKMRVQTNSLDSPRALQLYQQIGFTPIAVKNVEIEAWD